MGMSYALSEWPLKRFGEMFTVGHGKNQKNVETDFGEYPILGSGGEMGRANKFLYDRPSALIGRKGTIDRPQYMDSPFWTVDTLYYTIVNHGYSPKFIYYLFHTVEWYNYNEASGVPSLNARTIEKIERRIPPTLAEQEAIATALSDTDALIHGLEQLIAKKRAIKQGVMQELLRPKDWWSSKTFGEVFNFLGTANYSRDQMNGNGLVGCVHYGDIHMKWDDHLDLSRTALPTISDNQAARYPILQEGDLIISDASEDTEGVGKAVEVLNVNEIKAIAGLHTYLLRERGDEFVKGFRAYIQHINTVREQIFRSSTGMKVFGISKPNLRKVEIPIPPKPEQEMIVNVLNQMENELIALSERTAKYRLIKQGMMQELLTGRKRLV